MNNATTTKSTSMISVIVVGKNEGWRITKCLESIDRLINRNPEFDFEVLYIDSKSTDDSISRAKKFKYVNIYSISGETNSAIARNIGAANSKGKILFFVDGDMEVESDFISHTIKERQLNHEIITGHVDDYFYDAAGSFLHKSPRTYKINIPHESETLITTGGLMLLQRETWEAVGGMRNKYARSQDLDFCLRVQKKLGCLVRRLPYFLAKHHTIDYVHEDRMWKDLIQGYYFYPAMLFREHASLPLFFLRSLRERWGGFILIFAAIAFILSTSFGLFVLTTYISLNLLYTLKKSQFSKSVSRSLYYATSRFLFKIAVDFCFFAGLLFFFPRAKKDLYLRID